MTMKDYSDEDLHIDIEYLKEHGMTEREARKFIRSLLFSTYDGDGLGLELL
jgi:hypothetical protein